VIWRKGVNQIALWTAMREALDLGAERFSFGSTPAFQTSLREYKERFGGVSAALPHTAFGLDGGEIEQDGLLVRIGTPALRRMPVQLYRRFSPLLLREVV